jgi:hypothetical protein
LGGRTTRPVGGRSMTPQSVWFVEVSYDGGIKWHWDGPPHGSLDDANKRMAHSRVLYNLYGELYRVSAEYRRVETNEKE